MSTRGCVAVKKGNDFTGIYNHFDSYPAGLGADLWRYLQDAMKKNTLKEITTQLLKYDDWRNFLNGGICEYCGARGKGQPHSISGMVCSEPYEGKVQEAFEKTGYPDPKSKYHKHGKLTDKFTKKDIPDSWVEYVYVIDVKNKNLEIWHDEKKVIIDLEGKQPDWETL